MKHIRTFTAALLAVCLLLPLCIFGSAATEVGANEAEALHALGLLAGKGTNADGSVNFDLGGSLSRAESITQVVRFLGKEKAATAETHAHPFTDLPTWAIPYVSYAYANGVTKGVSDTKFGSGDPMTDAAFLTAMLRVLGYEDKYDGSPSDFSWDTPYALAKSVGLTDSETPNANFTRGDAFVICYNALTAQSKQGETIADSLVKEGVCDAAAMQAALGGDCAFTIGGFPLTDCKIVLAAEATATEKLVADELNAAIKAVYGKELPILTDATPAADGEIVIGATARPISQKATVESGLQEGVLFAEGTSLAIAAGSSSQLRRAVSAFRNQYLAGKVAVDMNTETNKRGAMIQMPLRAQNSGDPCIVYDNETEYYYALYSAPENGRVILYRAKTLAELGKAEGKTIYVAADDAEIKFKLYAPELAKMDGKWYIYASGATDLSEKGVSGASKSIRLFCLEATSDDPYGDYVFKAFLDPNIWAIDAHAFTYAGQNYIAFARILNGNCIGIAKLKNPWTIDTSRVSIISTAIYDFETKSGRINEGPFTFEHDGKLFLLYSANNVTSNDYSLGLLELTGNDPLSKASWTKTEHAVFVSTSKVVSPGHCSVFASPDGSELWLAYHYRANNVRMLGVKPFGFDESGMPVFGDPIAPGDYVFAPSGE